MRRDEMAPVAKEVKSPTHDIEYSHPAFGCVTVTNWTSGNAVRLFGSDLGHSGGITLAFYEATSLRGLSTDRHHPGPILLEIDMSESQWARFVASSGKGCGTPVTITAKRTGPIEQPPRIAAPELSKREVHGEEMRAQLHKKLETARKCTEAIAAMLDGSGSISKTALRAVYKDLDLAVSHLPGSTQFIYDTFAEATENLANDAKLEIEAFVDNLATQLGIEQLRLMAPQVGATAIEANDAMTEGTP